MRCTMLLGIPLIAIGLASAPLPAEPAQQADAGIKQTSAAGILKATGVQGGLIVHVGCGDGRLTAALRTSDAFLVHGLDGDPAHVQQARRHFQSLGLAGSVSADVFDGRLLPFGDNLVNLLLAEEPSRASDEELLRVVTPRGVVYRKQAGKWTKIVKPWPTDIDEWSHYLHDATGNAVAHDRVVDSPGRLQWIDGPLWARSHEYDSSLCAMVSAQGRLFAIFDEGPTGIIDPRIPDRWTLIARDAFNGVVLWKRPLDDWGWKAWKRGALEHADWGHMPSQRTALPLAISRRLVAAGERVYATLGYHAPLSALDAATGRTLTTYAGTEQTDEVLFYAGQLVLCLRELSDPAPASARKKAAARPTLTPTTLLALDSRTGRQLWRAEPAPILPLSTATDGRHVFYHDDAAVVCLDAATGRRQWRAVIGAAGGSIWNSAATLVAYRDVVLCLDRKQLVAFSAADGHTLWSLPGSAGFGAINPPDLFVADGLVWYGRDGLKTGNITGYDPQTGKPGRTVEFGPLVTDGHHARCYRSKATDNYLLLPKRGVEFVDLHEQLHSRNNWVRGACRFGVVPCNGLLYATPNPCFCYAGTKLGGFLALAPGRTSSPAALPVEDATRLQYFAAYDSTGSDRAAAVDVQDWPAYRRDPRRSGSTPARVETPLGPLWKTPLGGKLTQPVVAEDRVFVARVDAGQVCCLDAASGSPRWSYAAGGRVDSAPTYHRGRLLFGSADGYVYCLRASDGAPLWRLHAAPDDRRLVAYGQVESVWPVHGSVLVLDDVAYFAVGRSSFLDGGMLLYGVDPASGRKRYATRLDGPHPDPKVPDENAYAGEGAKSDLLVSDGKQIYLLHNAFDRQLQRIPLPLLGEPGVRNLGERRFGEHLFANAGFLDDSWFSRNHWMLGDEWTGFNFTQQAAKAGELLVFDDAQTYSVKCFLRRNVLSPLYFPGTDGFLLVADSNKARPAIVNPRQQAEYVRWLPAEGNVQRCWNLDIGYARAQPPVWKANIAVRLRALVATADALFAAGPPDVCDSDDPMAALEGRRGALLVTFNPRDGQQVAQQKLDAPPVFDGLSAAGGRLFLATIDGAVRCFAAAKK